MHATTEDFRSALLDSGLLSSTGIDGLYHRSASFERLVRAVEGWAAGLRTQPDAPRWHFPPFIERAAFLRTDYLRSFPDLTGTVQVFRGGDREHRALLATLDGGGEWQQHLEPSELVLASSICHPLYATLPPQVPEAGRLVECSGTAFRHEPSRDPARMQHFGMYEFVLIGTPAQALEHRDDWLARGREAMSSLGIEVRAEIASDPFFGRVGTMLSDAQRSAELKYELVTDLTEERSTAIASANYHEDHFGAPFGLSTPDGASAHSACFGFGLERTVLALLATHGMDESRWPTRIHDVLDR